MRDVALGFHIPPKAELAMRGFDFVVAAYQQACINNPGSGCNPDYQALAQAVMAYNFNRLPVVDRGRYFLATDEVPSGAPAGDASVPVRRNGNGGCASCGGRRR